MGRDALEPTAVIWGRMVAEVTLARIEKRSVHVSSQGAGHG